MIFLFYHRRNQIYRLFFTLSPYNKYYALDLFCKENNISHNEVVYIGDDYGLGGNDESVFVSDFNYLCINDYKTFPNTIKALLD